MAPLRSLQCESHRSPQREVKTAGQEVSFSSNRYGCPSLVCLLFGSSSQPIVFFSYTASASTSSHQPANNIFLSHYSSTATSTSRVNGECVSDRSVLLFSSPWSHRLTCLCRRAASVVVLSVPRRDATAPLVDRVGDPVAGSSTASAPHPLDSRQRDTVE